MRERTIVGAELDLTPVLSTIVHIIPIALIAVRFVTLHEHRVDQPLIVAEEAPSRELAAEQDENAVVVRILPTGFLVRGAEAGETSVPCVAPCGPDDYDYEALNALMVVAQARHPTTRQMVVVPDRAVTYQTIIGVFDAVTESGSGASRRPLFAEPVLIDATTPLSATPVGP